jgi:hypothetical protein
MANPNAAGVPGAEASSFSICMGRLDENQVAGPTVETCLVKIQLADGGAGSTDVTVAPDTLRGGVVGSTFAVTSVYEDGAFTQVNFAAPLECIKAGTALYTTWEAVGKPDCWCYARQCKGDVDGSDFFGIWVTTQDLNLFKAAFNQFVLPAGGICSDLDHADFFGIRVTTLDLNIFKTYYNQFGVTECDMTDYNFWVTP